MMTCYEVHCFFRCSVCGNISPLAMITRDGDSPDQADELWSQISEQHGWQRRLFQEAGPSGPAHYLHACPVCVPKLAGVAGTFPNIPYYTRDRIGIIICSSLHVIKEQIKGA